MGVVITGMGSVSAFGAGVDALWSGLVEGRSGIRTIDRTGGSWDTLPIRVGATVTTDLEDALGRVRARRLDRSQQLALVAAAEAWADAGVPSVDGARLAVVLGTGVGGLETMLDQDDVLEQSGPRRVSPRTVPMLMANAGAAQLSIEYGARAGAFTVVSACASGAEALATAARLIEDDAADIVIAGGAEAAVTPLTLAAFAQAQAIAKPVDGVPVDTLSRPFDADRTGFVLGEGAGIVVLERTSHATARGAVARATLAGWGITSDAFHMTATAPDGEGQIRAIRAALRRADLAPSDVDHVDAHATGTSIGDASEAVAIRAALGEHVSVTAPKGAIGHSFGAAGALEAIATVRTLETGTVPPTRNLAHVDPAIGLDVVAGAARTGEVRAAVSNSFGFGGHNASLLFTRA